MNRLFYTLLLILLVFSSCQQGSLKKQLVEIDSLIERDKSKEAFEKLVSITPEGITDEECLAYYWLLKIRVECHLNRVINSVEPLNTSIQYYTKKSDRNKLAQTYCIKGTILDDFGRIREAVLCLKEAEAVVPEKNKKLRHSIYSILGYINGKMGESRLEVEYFKRALAVSYQINYKTAIAHDLLSVSNAYSSLNKDDSAYYYMNKLLPIYKELPEVAHAFFYTNYGITLAGRNDSRAEKYLLKGISKIEDPYAYRVLGKIYMRKGDKAKALDMWAKALKTTDLSLKAGVLSLLYDAQHSSGDYKLASETGRWLASVKDSIAASRKKEDIRGIQEQFDHERREGELQQRIRYGLYAGGIAFFSALLAFLYIKRRRAEQRNAVLENRSKLSSYQQELVAAENTSDGDSQKEIDRLNKKIADLHTKQNDILANGKRLHEDIEQGGTTARWSKNDFVDYIEYYRLHDIAFVTRMETEYRHLSAKYIFFSVLEKTGRSDEDIQRIMGVSQSTVRSIRSRINGSKIDEDEG